MAVGREHLLSLSRFAGVRRPGRALAEQFPWRDLDQVRRPPLDVKNLRRAPSRYADGPGPPHRPGLVRECRQQARIARSGSLCTCRGGLHGGCGEGNRLLPITGRAGVRQLGLLSEEVGEVGQAEGALGVLRWELGQGISEGLDSLFEVRDVSSGNGQAGKTQREVTAVAGCLRDATLS